MNKLLTILSLLLVCWPIGHVFGEQSMDPMDFSAPWKLIKSEPPTRIYRHPFPNNGISTFKVDTVLDAPMDQVVALIRDIPSYVHWIPNCQTSKLLSKTQKPSMIYYIAVEAPWPVRDRDWVNELTIIPDLDKNELTATFKAYHGFMPPKDDYIRVTEHDAIWKLIPLSPQKTRSIWQWYTDPGGSIPDWLVDWTAETQLLESLENINRLLNGEAY